MEVPKIIFFMKYLGSNSRRVGCCSILLQSSQTIGMHNDHERLQVIRQDTYVRATYQSCLQTYKSPLSRQRHTPHTITDVPPDSLLICRGRWIPEFLSTPVHIHPQDRIRNEIFQTRPRVIAIKSLMVVLMGTSDYRLANVVTTWHTILCHVVTTGAQMCFGLGRNCQ